MNLEPKVQYVKDAKQPGYYFIQNPGEKLIATTRVINLAKPFSDQFYKVPESIATEEKDLNGMWISKIFERNNFLNGVDESKIEFFESEAKDEEKISLLSSHNKVSAFLKKELKQLQDNGNQAEAYLLDLLQGKEVIDDNLPADYARLCFDLLREEIGLEGWDVIYQLPVGSRENGTVGIIDFLLINKNNGRSILLDMKTGSNVAFQKLDAVILQVVGSYAPKLKENYGFYPNGCFCLSAFTDKVWDWETKEKKWTKSARLINLTTAIHNRKLVSSNSVASVQYEFNQLVKAYKILKKFQHIK